MILPGEPKPRFMWAPVTTDHDGSKRVYPGTFLDYSLKSLAWKNLESSNNVWTREPPGYVVQVRYDATPANPVRPCLPRFGARGLRIGVGR